MANTEVGGILSRVDIFECSLWLDEEDGETRHYEFETNQAAADYYLMVSRKVKLSIEDDIVITVALDEE